MLSIKLQCNDKDKLIHTPAISVRAELSALA